MVERLPRTFFPFHSGQKTGELLFHTDVQTCHLFSSGWPGNGRNGHFLQTEPMAQFLVEPKYKEKYILVYQLGINKEIVDFAHRLHDKTGYRVVYIPFPLVGLLKCDCKISVGPAEWMGLFKNAEYVISDSFHGVVFSLIFNRKFFAKVNGHHMNRRVQQLLNMVNLTDRTMDDVSYEKLTEEIDFTYANEQLARFREHSMEQLRKMVSAAEVL